MSKSRLRGRAGIAGAIALVCASAVACDSVLDIQDPMIRPPEGEGGEPTSGGTAGTATAGSATTPEGGGAGEGGTNGGSGGTDAIPGGAGSGGEGGVNPGGCKTDSVQCNGNKPERCDEFGHWVQNEAEAAGECAVQCSEGRCVECLPQEKRCAVCADGEAGCNTNQPQSCVDGAWENEGSACKHYCDGGECVTPPSCRGTFESTTTCSNLESCCRSQLVSGGHFIRDYDGSEEFPDLGFTAQVSDFFLDKFEVTVGRMRAFVDAYSQVLLLSEGQGKSNHISDDTGWKTTYELPKTKEALIAEFKSCGSLSTWRDVPENNDLPINCVSFNVAYAFCVWDTGRLPTEAEWNFAATGGSEQRAFPWLPKGDAPITKDHAHYGSPEAGPTAVGSKPLGNGRWGQSDLSGNVSEWLLDYFQEYPLTCKDCLNTAASSDRSERGGAYLSIPIFLSASLRNYAQPETVDASRGFRCARDRH